MASVDQSTNRLCEQKTGSALKNRRIKARTFRAFCIGLFAPPPKAFDARWFKRSLFFVQAATGPARLRWPALPTSLPSGRRITVRFSVGTFLSLFRTFCGGL
jgi:hypothetical protein